MASHSLIVCTFDSDTQADAASAAIQALDQQLDAVKLGNIAIIRKTADGHLSFFETDELREYTRDTTFGMILGWLLGAANTIVGAPLGTAVGIETGAALGNEVAATRDIGFPDDALRQVGEHLHMGSAALVTLVTSEQAPIVVEQLNKLGGTILQGALSPATLAELEQ